MPSPRKLLALSPPLTHLRARLLLARAADPQQRLVAARLHLPLPKAALSRGHKSHHWQWDWFYRSHLLPACFYENLHWTIIYRLFVYIYTPTFFWTFLNRPCCVRVINAEIYFNYSACRRSVYNPVSSRTHSLNSDYLSIPISSLQFSCFLAHRHMDSSWTSIAPQSIGLLYYLCLYLAIMYGLW